MRKSLPGRPAVVLSLPIHPSLKDLMERAACDAGVHLNEWVARLAAEELDRPDLAAIPRRKMGRPKKAELAPA